MRKAKLTSIFVAFALFITGNFALAGLLLATPWQLLTNTGTFGAPGAELLQRFFLTEIQPQLFPSNLFFNQAKDDSAWVNFNTVELPHSGNIPAVTVNRGSLPGTVAKRTDNATSYALEELTTDPTLLQDSEALVVAYDKRASILNQHVMAINDKAALRCMYNWANGMIQGTNLLPTTGAARAAGAGTGTRLAITKADFLLAKLKLDSQNIPLEGRVCVLPPAMYADLLAIPEFSYFQQYGQVVLPSGVLQRALGFDIYIRSETQLYTKAGGPVYTLKAEGSAAIAATDCQGALFYNRDYVRKAKGNVKVYVSPDRPEYYGSIFSTMVRFGSAQVRNDQKGIVVVVEG